MTVRFLPRILAVLVFAVSALAACGTMAGERSVTVFAAASLKTALDEVAARFTAEHDANVSLSYAGSSALARQIQFGAPADIFISANTQWMDILERDDLLLPGSRRVILGNRLVLIGPRGSGVMLTLSPETDLLKALDGGRLAMALVDAVPAGIYGQAALRSLGLWDSVADRVAQTDNVRAALRLVASGQTALGIVYASDAMADPHVETVALFATQTHPDIQYPAALTIEASGPTPTAFLTFLTSPEAQAIFTRHGFLPGPAS